MMTRRQPHMQLPHGMTNWLDGANQMLTALDITHCLFQQTLQLMSKVVHDILHDVPNDIEWKSGPFYTSLVYLRELALVLRPDTDSRFNFIIWSGDKPCWGHKNQTVKWTKFFTRNDVNTKRPMQFPINHDYDLVDSEMTFQDMIQKVPEWINEHGGTLKESASNTFSRSTKFSCCHSGFGLALCRTPK